MAPYELENGSFELPKVDTGLWNVPDASKPDDENHVPGWMTTAENRELEIWKSGHERVTSVDGGQFAELNTAKASTLYQDLQTTPGSTMHWRLLHKGRSSQGDDTMALLVGPADFTKLVAQAEMSDGSDAWGEHRGSYEVPEGQTTTRFAFMSVSVASDDKSIGNFLDAVVFTASDLPDELAPITIYEEGEKIVPRPEIGTEPYMVIHQVSGHYLLTDDQTVSDNQALQTWCNFPLNTTPGYHGYLWHFEKYGTEPGEYLIRTHEESVAEKAPLYIEAGVNTAASRLEHPRIKARTTATSAAAERQVWILVPVTSDPTTYAIVPKAFDTHALGCWDGIDDGDQYVIPTPTYGRPTYQHYWSLSKQASLAPKT